MQEKHPACSTQQQVHGFDMPKPLLGLEVCEIRQLVQQVQGEFSCIFLPPCSSSVRKRSFHAQNTDLVASAKKTKIISDKAAKNKNKFHHIREIMNRLRINRIREKDVFNDGLRSADNFVEKQESISNGFAPLVKQQAEKTHVINCKPCVVVLKRILMDNK